MNLQESIRRILKGVAKKLSNKLHCDRHGSCVHFAELFVEEINNTHPELLKEFEVIEGYVDVKFGEGKPQEHTWIRLSDDEVIDPTFMQFTKYDKNAKYSRKRTKSYTGQEYYDKGVIESWFSKRREEQPDTVFKGGLEESIRRILREEKKLILLIRRRVPYDVLDGEFNSSLQFATHLFKKNKFMTLERFVFITISSMIDGIHYYIHSTTSEGSHWYDDVFNSLKDYYKGQIDHRYNLLSKV